MRGLTDLSTEELLQLLLLTLVLCALLGARFPSFPFWPFKKSPDILQATSRTLSKALNEDFS